MAYSTLSSLPKRSTLSQYSWGGLDNNDILLFKILQNITKRSTGGLFDYYGIISKEEK